MLALGPSKDGTDAVALELAAADPRVRTVPTPRPTPDGLNAAIAAATGHRGRVDGHADSPTTTSRRRGELTRVGADNVGGIMDAEGLTAFERAVACAMRSPIGVGNARFHVGGEAGAADTVYLGVFRRAPSNGWVATTSTSPAPRTGSSTTASGRPADSVWFTPD